jgi:hypothetical protein
VKTRNFFRRSCYGATENISGYRKFAKKGGLRVTLDQIASFAEIIGGLAVLVTLVYLAVGLRENTKILRADATTATYLNWSAFNEFLSQHPDRLLFGRAFDQQEVWGNFEPIEQLTLSCLGRAMIQKFSSVFYQHEAGILDAEVWRQNSIWCHSFLEYPVWRDFWEEECRQPIYSEAFLSAIEKAPTTDISIGAIMNQ